MIYPIINLLKYNGNTLFGDQLLLGIDPYLPSFHENTKSFLKHLGAIKGRLPPPATPITHQEYTDEFNSIRESTYLGPSDTIPNMVKTKDLDTEPMEIRRL